MYAKSQISLSARNIALGLLLAASLILPTLAHANTLVVRTASVTTSWNWQSSFYFIALEG
jgi:hypothetical protein